MDSVSDTLSILVRTIICYFKKEYGLTVKKHVAYIGKQLALKELYGKEGISYHQLVWYTEELTRRHPRNCVDQINKETCKFERVFIAVEACIHGFKYCRPMVYLDGTFLGTKYKGCLMVATVKNGDQGKHLLF
ncbi:hypothetical protein IFM89_038885 [Coptis chinensis]|uniref:Transposase n=1 Tax=Coptis chinensis TaxID=261450 RepID=A0A835MK75_9MAGN|nr:hypothetical protein IFM89_038885 [Coptis chinensis]